MFGIGFTELLLIAIIAILFLGPDKLPETMVQIAKFIKSIKKTISDAKASLEEEVRIADLKEEALHYKQQLDKATNELRDFKNIDMDALDEIVYDDPSDLANSAKDPNMHTPQEPQETSMQTEIEQKRETVTLKKRDTDTGKDNEASHATPQSQSVPEKHPVDQQSDPQKNTAKKHTGSQNSITKKRDSNV